MGGAQGCVGSFYVFLAIWEQSGNEGGFVDVIEMG